MVGKIQFWLCVLLLALGCFFALLIVMKIAKMLLQRKGASASDVEPGANHFTKVMLVIINGGKLRARTTNGMMLVMGIITGAAYMDLRFTHQEIERLHSVDTYYNLHVLGHTADMLTVEFLTKQMQPVPDSVSTLKFCPSFIPDIDDDSIIVKLTFMQAPACIDIRDQFTGFTILRDQNRRPIKYSKLKENYGQGTGTGKPGAGSGGAERSAAGPGGYYSAALKH